MRAFLCHSSKDKGFVDNTADLMRPGTYELDSQTFDAGLVNSAAIIQALERSDLFCLFLSTQSVRAPYVEFETLLGIEFFARGKIERFVAICLDEKAFDQATANVQFFNIIRKCFTPEQAARFIQGQLISATTAGGAQAHPFIGREAELLEGQVNDHARPLSKAIYVSGNFGSGRRTLAQSFSRTSTRKSERCFRP